MEGYEYGSLLGVCCSFSKGDSPVRTLTLIGPIESGKSSSECSCSQREGLCLFILFSFLRGTISQVQVSQLWFTFFEPLPSYILFLLGQQHRKTNHPPTCHFPIPCRDTRTGTRPACSTSGGSGLSAVAALVTGGWVTLRETIRETIREIISEIVRNPKPLGNQNWNLGTKPIPSLDTARKNSRFPRTSPESLLPVRFPQQRPAGFLSLGWCMQDEPLLIELNS